LILWLKSNHFLSNIWHEIQLIQNFRIDVMTIDSKMFARKRQSRLFHAIVNWLWIEFMLTVLIDRKICCAKCLKSFSNRAFVRVYLKFWSVDNADDVRFLKRIIMTWYQDARLTCRRRSFFMSNNSIECQIRTASRKHWDKTIRSLSFSRIAIMSLSRSMKA
jgi:hypothetical protein